MPIASLLSVFARRLLGPLLLLASLQSHAFTLGAIQGAVLIGQPLDVAVQVQLDPDETVTSACFSADVFHGDARQNPSGVAVRLETTSLPSTALVHITSRSRVDEPIVTVYLRAGCAQMSSRRYTVLVDFVDESDTPAVPRVAAVPLVNPTSTTSTRSTKSTKSAVRAVAEGAGFSAQATATESRPATNVNRVRQPRARSQAARRATPTPSKRVASVLAAPVAVPKVRSFKGGSDVMPKVAAVGRGEGQSRLTLDPLDMLSERVATLESNATAPPPPVDERSARESERLDRLEVSVKALLVLAQKNEASLMDVRSRIDKAQADRSDKTVIYILFGLLLLSLLAIVYLLTRMNRRQDRDGSRWFDAGHVADPDPGGPAPKTRSARSPLSQPGALADTSPAAGSTPVPMEQTDSLPTEPTKLMPHQGGERDEGGSHALVDVSLVEMSESTFDRLMQSGAANGGARQTREAVAPTPRIDADTLIDIRQRAEFFVSLGQTDQAVQVLEVRIAEDAASCPQVHLDLLKLFHSLGLKADFNQVSEDFTRLFNTGVPDFSDFGHEGRSLEDYPGVIDRLIAAWPRPHVLGTLEQLIYRGEPRDAAREPFDLAAFRDLLLLHAVTQSVYCVAGGRSGDASANAVANEAAQVDINLSEPDSQELASTLIRPRDDAQPSIPNTEAQADTTQSGHLIDFDLSDGALDGKSGTGDR